MGLGLGCDGWIVGGLGKVVHCGCMEECELRLRVKIVSLRICLLRSNPSGGSRLGKTKVLAFHLLYDLHDRH